MLSCVWVEYCLAVLSHQYSKALAPTVHFYWMYTSNYRHVRDTQHNNSFSTRFAKCDNITIVQIPVLEMYTQEFNMRDDIWLPWYRGEWNVSIDLFPKVRAFLYPLNFSNMNYQMICFLWWSQTFAGSLCGHMHFLLGRFITDNVSLVCRNLFSFNQ